ncbi:MAG TPA: hypothetical protein VNO30_21000, partial [Kofleriaceae bacterium]|nr:hypothetical protein [Kofleriaceae bacterium]
MSRIALASVVAAVAIAALACSKSAGSKDSPPIASSGSPEQIAVPGGEGGRGGVIAGGAQGDQTGAPAGGGAAGANDDAYKLKPDEGQLSIEVPSDAVAGQETTARVVVTPTPKFKINFDFPTKLTLEAPADVTLAKAELKAG